MLAREVARERPREIEKSIATSASGQSSRPALSISTRPAIVKPSSGAQRLDQSPHPAAPENQNPARWRGSAHRPVPRRAAVSNAASCNRCIAVATSRSLKHHGDVPPRRRLRTPSSAAPFEDRRRAGDPAYPVLEQLIPTAQSMRHRRLDGTSANVRGRGLISSSSRSSSIVTDTLTSEVVTTSTGGPKGLEHLEHRRRNHRPSTCGWR